MYTAILRHLPMGFWSPGIRIQEAKRRGVQVLSVDVNHSQAQASIEEGSIRIGFDSIKGFGELPIQRILDGRQARPYGSLTDLCQRTRLSRNLVEDLIVSGALDSFDERRTLLWELRTLDYQEDRFDLVYPTEVIDFPDLSPVERMFWEQEKLGLSTGDHIMSYYRSWLQERGILGSHELNNCRNGDQVTVAGLKVVRQSPPTTTKTFITLEDEAGFINVVVSQKIWQRYRKVWQKVPLLLVKGMVEHQGSVIDVIATYVTRLPVEIREVA